MASIDAVKARDDVAVSVERDPVPPRFPCPQCGKESKQRDGSIRACVGCGNVFIDGPQTIWS